MTSKNLLRVATPIAAAALFVGVAASTISPASTVFHPTVTYAADEDGEDGPGNDYSGPYRDTPGGDNTGTHAGGNGTGAGVTTGGGLGTDPGAGDSPDVSSAFPGGGNTVPTPEGGAIGTGEGVTESP